MPLVSLLSIAIVVAIAVALDVDVHVAEVATAIDVAVRLRCWESGEKSAVTERTRNPQTEEDAEEGLLTTLGKRVLVVETPSRKRSPERESARVTRLGAHIGQLSRGCVGKSD
jgi:hypothetical protein